MKLLASSLALVAVSAVNPVDKVVQLLHGMKDQLKAEEATEQGQFNELMEWCKEQKEDKTDAIRAEKDQISAFEATIEQANGDIAAESAAIDTHTGDISSTEEDLAAARKVRAEEKAAFEKMQKELSDAVGTLQRAGNVLKKAGFNGSPGTNAKLFSLVQEVVQGLSTVMSAASIENSDRQRLQSLIQSMDDEGDSDDGLAGATGAPQGAAYTPKAGAILDVIADMKVKAETELNEARTEEMKKQHSFELLEQSLEDKLAQSKKDLGQAKDGLAGAQEQLGEAKGDLAETSAALSSDQEVLQKVGQQCASQTEAFNARVKARAEEVATIEKAVEILKPETSEGFLLQMTDEEEEAPTPDPREEAADVLQKVASSVRSMGLAQLASRLREGNDPFAKVKGMIEAMINKLLKQHQEEATKQAWCEGEKKKTKASRDAKQGKVDKNMARLEKASAKEAQLKNEITDISAELANMAAQLAEAEKLRNEEAAEFAKAEKELTASKDALQAALQVLQDYYSKNEALVQQSSSQTQPAEFGAYEKNSDGASGIIGMLEQTLAETTESLAERQAEEEQAKADFKTYKQEDEVNRATKEAEVKGKEGEVKRLAATVTELKSDLQTQNAELDATLDYLEQVRNDCTHKPMSFEERQAKRQKEIDGLKEALDILSPDGAASDAFLQKRVSVHLM